MVGLTPAIKPSRALPPVLALVVACGSPAEPRAVSPSATTKPPIEAPAPDPPRLAAIDVYGSKVVSEASILAEHETAIRAAWAAAPAERSQKKSAIVAAIEAHPGIAFAKLSAIIYFEKEGPVGYMTIDLVDQADAARRMRFWPPPSGQPTDSAGIVTAWRAYEARVFELLQKGELSSRRTSCRAWHCLGDSGDPRLADLIAPIRSGAEANKDDLVAILFEHRDPATRASAAFALAHTDDGVQLVDWMLKAMFDSSAMVRNNAMRVLADVAAHHGEIPIPVEPLLLAIDFPTTTDRNKALAVLAGLLSRPDSERVAALISANHQAVGNLVALLALKQPNNRDFAYQIIRRVSGESFAADDLAAWRSWLRSWLDSVAP